MRNCHALLRRPAFVRLRCTDRVSNPSWRLVVHGPDGFVDWENNVGAALEFDRPLC